VARGDTTRRPSRTEEDVVDGIGEMEEQETAIRAKRRPPDSRGGCRGGGRMPLQQAEPAGGDRTGRSRRPHVGARCGSELRDGMRDLLRSSDCDSELEDDVAASFTP
jgi:hypothetical protein